MSLTSSLHYIFIHPGIVLRAPGIWSTWRAPCAGNPLMYVGRCLRDKNVESTRVGLFCNLRAIQNIKTPDFQAESMLLCEGCNHSFHIYCLRPALSAIPASDWFCTSCSNKVWRTCTCKQEYLFSLLRLPAICMYVCMCVYICMVVCMYVQA